MSDASSQINQAQGVSNIAPYINVPDTVPAEPQPAIARPIIRAAEFGARAQTSEPSSSNATDPKKTHLTGKNL